MSEKANQIILLILFLWMIVSCGYMICELHVMDAKIDFLAHQIHEFMKEANTAMD